MKPSGEEPARKASELPEPSSGVAEGRVAPRRARPDLSALFAEVDEKAASQPPVKQRSPLDRLAGLGQAELAQSETTTASRGGDVAPPKTTFQPPEELLQTGEHSLPSAGARLSLPPELQRYLSPELWRKLNSADPPRGVLINALERMRSVQYLLGTFLPAHLVQEKLRRPFAGQMSVQVQRGSLLFADVSGFTALSERLAGLGTEGAEVLTGLMNRYFTVMLEILAWSGGILLKFAGDALLVWFPAGEEAENPLGGEQAPHAAGIMPHAAGIVLHAGQALRAAQRMLRAMSSFAQLETPAGPARLTMKIGLAAGQFLAVSAGTAERMEYFVLGPAVTQVMAAEGASSGGGQIVLNREAAAAVGLLSLPEVQPGFYLLEKGAEQAPSDDFEIVPETRRGRGAIPWSATSQAILAQVEVALRQVLALQPYLPPELLERILAPGRGRQLQSEYRQATVMFVNFVGPEALYSAWGETGAARVAALLQAFFVRMQSVVQRYGGMISRVDPYSRGTKMLILFGVPTAHEDDAQRAVSAALAMQNELPGVEEAWRQKYGRYLETVPALQEAPLLQMRIGITFGQTFAGQVGSSTRREYTVMGDDVNLAARLMGAAEFGRVLINPAVQERVQGLFFLTERTPLKVKGKSRPITVFQVEGPREDTLAERRQRRGPLIGRQEALAQGLRVVQDVLKGRGRWLIIQGPAGSGKSHLADELLRRMLANEGASGAGPPDIRCLEVQCRSFQTELPYAAWSRLIRTLAGITSLDLLPAQRAAKLRRLINDVYPDETQVERGHLLALAALLGLSEAELGEAGSQQVSLPAEAAETTVKGVEKAVSATDTFAFVRQGGVRRRGSQLQALQQLDGLQQSTASEEIAGITRYRRLAALDDDDREQLRNAIEALLVGITAGLRGQPRPAAIFFEDAHWMDAASRRLLEALAPRLQQLPLLILCAQRNEQAEPAGRLPSAVSEAATVINLGPLSAAETEALVAHLLVSDLGRVIYDQTQGAPLLVSEVARWFKRTHHLDPQELQDVLQASDILQKLVLSGLEALPEATRQVARVAAVISDPAAGAEFRTSEVQALLGEDVDPVSLSQHLRALARGRWIALSEAGADASYHFPQALTREVLYNSLPHEQRRLLHGRLAAYLEAQQRQEMDGGDEGANRRRLQRRLAAALGGKQLSPEQSHALIAFHYEQAEDWLAAAQHLIAAGQLAERGGQPGTACQNFQRALDLLSRLPETGRMPASVTDVHLAEALTQAWQGLGDSAFLRRDDLSALNAFENALASLPAPASPERRLGLVCRLALSLARQKRLAEAIQRLQAQMEAAGEEAADWLPAALILTWLYWRQADPGLLAQLQHAQALLEAVEFEIRGWPEQEPHPSQLWAAILQGFSGQWQQAAQGFLEAGQAVGLAVAYLHQGESALQGGELAQAISYFQLVESVWRQWPGKELSDGLGSCQALALFLQAKAQLAKGDPAAAQRLLEQALEVLEGDATCLRADGRPAIQGALKQLAAQKEDFPAWTWQGYEDAYYAQQLFRLLRCDPVRIT